MRTFARSCRKRTANGNAYAMHTATQTHRSGTMKRRKRKLGPWELSHKTYSFRAPPELRDRIEALRKEKPLQEILLKGLGLVEGEVHAYRRGYRDGIAYTYDRGKFKMPCSRCGKPMVFDMSTPNDRAGVEAALKAKGWRHTSCSKK